MKKILILLLTLLIALSSCKEEKSSLNLSFYNNTGYSRIVLKGRNYIKENTVYADSVTFSNLDEGIYTLEAMRYESSEMTGYIKETIRIREGMNEKTLAYKVNASLPFVVHVKTNSSLIGATLSLDLDGFSQKLSTIDSNGEAYIAYSPLTEDAVKSLKYKIVLENGKEIENETKVTLKSGGSFDIDISYYGDSESDAGLTLEEYYSSPLRGKIEVDNIDIENGTIALSAKTEKSGDIEYVWYVDSMYYTKGKSITLKKSDDFKRVDVVFQIENEMGSLGSASIIFTNL